jgi:hypothetical protein
MDMKPHILWLEMATPNSSANERGQAWCLAFLHSLHVSFSDHMHCFLSFYTLRMSQK